MNRCSIISLFAAVVVIYFGAAIQLAGAEKPSYDKIEQALAQKVDFKPQVVTLNKLAEMIAKKFDIQVELDLEELRKLTLGGESIFEEGEDPFDQDDEKDEHGDPFAQKDEEHEDGDPFDQEPEEGDDPIKEIGKKEQVDKVNAPGDTQVEIRFTGISLRSFLHFHLQTLDEELGFVVFPDRILITTKEKRDHKLILRVYDIRDLVRSDSQPAKDSDWVAEVIQSTVRPATWRDVGGPASLQDKDGLYSISQYSESHVRIKELLKTLRHIKARQKKSPGGKSAALGQYPAQQDAREKIFAQLKNKRILLNFHEATLQDVVRQLHKTLGVPVVLDQPTLLNEVGVSTYTDVSIKTAKLPARDALKLMLRKIDPKLAYSIRNEMLVITTSEEAEYDDLTGRIYPVADLVTAKRPSAPGSRLTDYDDLYVLITKSIDPESWGEAGGWGSLGEVEALSSVIIYQSDENHEKIEDLLAKLRDGSIKMPARQPARRPPAPNGADPIRPAAATPPKADDPEGIEEVHPDERAAVRVVCKKTERGYLDKEGRVVRLWFSGIGVTDAELDRLKEFSKLKNLYFEGSITDAELKHLAGLPSLEYLFISGPQITDEGLVHLAGLPQLDSLGLYNTKVTDGGLVHLRNLKHLQYLGLFGPGITGEGLTHLKDLPRLTRLILGGSDVTDNGLAALRKNPSVTYLSLSNTKVTDACLPHLATLKQLEALDLDGTRISGARMSHVWDLQQLEVLDVSNTALTDSALAGIKRCRSLQYLDLRDTQITAAGLDHLLELESLETLWLTAEGEITPEVIREFTNAFRGRGTDDRPRNVEVNPRGGSYARGPGPKVFRRKESTD